MSKPNKLNLLPGDYIFREGEFGHTAYIIESGSVELIGVGVCGIVLFNFNGDILAWEQCPPNHAVNSSCPKLNISGVQLSCECTQNLYSLATGQLLNNINQNNRYPLVRYRTDRVGSSLRVYN